MIALGVAACVVMYCALPAVIFYAIERSFDSTPETLKGWRLAWVTEVIGLVLMILFFISL